MTIDNVIVSKQVNIAAEKGTIDLRVQATDVCPEDAIRANALFDRFVGEMSGQRTITKHQVVVPWEDDEKAIVLAAKTTDEAWEKYHEAFPDSKRKSSTVRRWWKNNQGSSSPGMAGGEQPQNPTKSPETPATPSGSEKPHKCASVRKGAKKPQKTKGLGANKWQIPFSTTTQKKEYQRAWLLCRSYNLPYPEALKKEQEKKSEAGKTPEKKTAPVQKAEPVGGARPQEMKVKDLTITEEPVEPKKGGQDKVDTSSVPRSDNVTTPDKEVGKDPAPKTVRLIRGMQVRYIGSHPNVAFSGLKEVKRVNDLAGEALIDIGRGIEWIPSRDLAVAT